MYNDRKKIDKAGLALACSSSHCCRRAQFRSLVGARCTIALSFFGGFASAFTSRHHTRTLSCVTYLPFSLRRNNSNTWTLSLAAGDCDIKTVSKNVPIRPSCDGPWETLLLRRHDRNSFLLLCFAYPVELAREGVSPALVYGKYFQEAQTKR